MINRILQHHKLHFVGIGGIGMSALALICHHRKYQVTGSDMKESSVTQKLQGLGIPVVIGHSKDNIENAEAVIYTSAAKQDNLELVAARQKGLPVFRRGELLGEVISTYKSIAVAGTHGKTTVTAMIAWILKEGGMSPTALIGGILPSFGGNTLIGNGEWLVAEADESDESFLYLHPTITVVTNVELDHVDHYRDLDAVTLAFENFLSQTQPGGWKIICRDNAVAVSIGESETGNLKWYGENPSADFKIKNYRINGDSFKSEIVFGEKELGELKMVIPGRVNMVNAAAALCVGHLVGLDFPTMAEALSRFEGVKRRQEFKGTAKGIVLIDDYAHHPTEIQVTLNALREKYSGRQIAVFQPHRYSRTQSLAKDFAAALEHADLVILTDVYGAAEKEITGISGETILQYASKKIKWIYLKDKRSIPENLGNICHEGDVLITLGAGDIYKFGEKFLESLKEKVEP